jgi:hypothetical protein
MTLDFLALGHLDVQCDRYVPRTIEPSDGTVRPYGIRLGGSLFVGPETYKELDNGSTDLVVLCLDCPAPCACDLLSCAECVSRSPFHHADPDKCICSSVPGRCPAYGFGFCACVCHGAVVKENRPASVEGDRERGVECREGATPLPKICAPNRNS